MVAVCNESGDVIGCNRFMCAADYIDDADAKPPHPGWVFVRSGCPSCLLWFLPGGRMDFNTFASAYFAVYFVDPSAPDKLSGNPHFYC